MSQSDLIRGIAQLRARVDTLEAEVERYRGIMRDAEADCPSAWGLTATETKVAALLLRRRGKMVTHESIISYVWGDEEPDSVENVMCIHVSRIRRKVRPHGLDIEMIWGRGYKLVQVDAHH